MAGKVKCPVCGYYYFDEPHDLDICQICYWINDEHQIRDPDLVLTNPMSLNDAREAYKKGLPIRPGLKPKHPTSGSKAVENDDVLLKDGSKARIIEIRNDSYVVDVDVGDDYETRTIEKSEVAKVLFSSASF